MRRMGRAGAGEGHSYLEHRKLGRHPHTFLPPPPTPTSPLPKCSPSILLYVGLVVWPFLPPLLTYCAIWANYLTSLILPCFPFVELQVLRAELFIHLIHGALSSLVFGGLLSRINFPPSSPVSNHVPTRPSQRQLF